MERFPKCNKQKTNKQKWDATIAHLVELEIHITKGCRNPGLDFYMLFLFALFLVSCLLCTVPVQ